MAPAGRRRALPSASYILAFILLFFSPAALAASAVLGIDFGTEYIKAALVKPGIPLEIVLTKDSKRKESSAIAFKASTSSQQDAATFPERLYGGDALALAARIPGDVYPNLKHLLGAASPYGDAAVEVYKLRYPALALTVDALTGQLGFTSKSFGSGGETFTVEELLGMELRGIRENAENMAGSGSTVRDAVVTVPSFYTAEERRAVESAMQLAGMKAVGLISDGLAVGLNYATLRTFGNPQEGGKAEHHVVFDMGAGSTVATVLKMQGKTVKDVGRYNKTVQEVSVIGAGWDRSLGGDALNDLIVSDMVDRFVQTKEGRAAKVDATTIKTHGRAMSKLTREAERLRQVLSANTATSASFEGLYDDIDFRYKLSRAEFEELASSFVGRVAQPITDALKQADLTIADLDSIILHGGAIRTPFVQNALESLVGNPAKLKSNVNADEAAVFGAAFKSASLSPSFRVKEIRTRELATYPVAVHWSAGDKERKQNIFLPTSSTGTIKQMPFSKSTDFDFSVSQSVGDSGAAEALTKPVIDVKMTNLTASVEELVTNFKCARGNISVAIGFQIDPATGLPDVVRGTASCESDFTTEKKGGVVDGVKGLFGFGKKDQKPFEDGEEELVIEMLPEETTESAKPSSTKSSKSASTTGKEDKVKPKKLHTFNLSFDTQRAGSSNASKDELKRVRDRLAAFDKSDLSRRQLEEIYNKLEGYTYRVRDMLTDSSFMDVSSSAQRKAIETLLGTTSEWLSADGAKATYGAIKEKLSGLTSLVDPVQQRKSELAKRPQSIEMLQEALHETQSTMRMVRDHLDRTAASASAAAIAAAASASSAAASVVSVLTDSDGETTATPSSDNLDDFESATTASASPTTSSKPSQLPDLSIWWTEDDYIRASTVYESVKDWFAEKSSAQDLLGAFDNPVLSTAEIEKRAQQLNQLTDELIRKLSTPSATFATPKRSRTSSSKFKIPTPKVWKSTSTAADAEASPSSTAEGIRIPKPIVSMMGEDDMASVAAKLSKTVVEQAAPAETVASSVVTDEETPAPKPVREVPPRNEL